ncbi:MAG: ATP-binding protein, partial [Spirochaetales bacterium]|nr:ATP-binding protein [Spirochaetales bacterium]
IDSLGDPESYRENLGFLVRNENMVSSLTLKDSSGRELNVVREEDNTVDVYLTDSESEDSLTTLREEAGMNYASLQDYINPALSRQFSPLRLSESYTLPNQNQEGITIYYRLYSNSENYLEMWIDYSLQQLAETVSEYSVNEDTVVFVILNEEDYVSYAIKDLMNVRRSPGEIPEELEPNKDPLDAAIIKNIYDLGSDPSNPPGDVTRIMLENSSWWIQYSKVNLLDSSIIMGGYTPESSMILSRLQSPLLVIFALVSALITGYFFLLFNDYRKVIQKQLIISEEEKVKQQILLGENLYCEFKSSMRWDYREETPSKVMEQVIMKSISAFSNSDGGTLLIGVKDDGEILGLDKDYDCLKEPGKDYYELHLRTLLSNMFGVAYPVSNIKVDFPEINGKEICRIQIRKGEEPLYLVSNEKGSGKTEKFFVRSGNSSRQISSLKEVTDYIMNRFR